MTSVTLSTPSTDSSISAKLSDLKPAPSCDAITTTSSTHPVFVVSHPFDVKTSCAVRLRSADNVDFFVNAVIATMASPVFAKMLLPGNIENLAREEDGTAIIHLPEWRAVVVDTILRIIYPSMRNPDIPSVSHIYAVLKAARQFDMGLVQQVAQSSLAQFVPSDPVRVFAVACAFGFEKEAADAAQAAIHCRKAFQHFRFEYLPEMQDVSAGMMSRFSFFVNKFGSVPNAFSFIYPTAGASPALSSGYSGIKPGAELIKVADSCTLTHAIFSRIPNDLIVYSSVNAEETFSTHKFAVMVSSPVLADRLRDVSLSGLPKLVLPESVEVLRCLLRNCYRALNLDVDVVDERAGGDRTRCLVGVALAAAKYKMAAVVKLAHGDLLSLIETLDPLEAYFVASLFGWEVEARLAARNAVEMLPDFHYVPVMEEASAMSYTRLLQYRVSVQEAVKGVVKEYVCTNSYFTSPVWFVGISPPEQTVPAPKDYMQNYCGVSLPVFVPTAPSESYHNLRRALEVNVKAAADEVVLEFD
ncbi:hypothetical protein EUX98_g4508 [Antrodiella citrinella]|uniref:BTB domain-containing protein n=1 Tax=Antrodiella citrinella TaxID=2447956 RepID=A0A4S4MVT5_9APHY|nr:hypothetical protein EUX98_g4508 [Antrodiella citrinella]